MRFEQLDQAIPIDQFDRFAARTPSSVPGTVRKVAGSEKDPFLGIPNSALKTLHFTRRDRTGVALALKGNLGCDDWSQRKVSFATKRARWTAGRPGTLASSSSTVADMAFSRSSSAMVTECHKVARAGNLPLPRMLYSPASSAINPALPPAAVVSTETVRSLAKR